MSNAIDSLPIKRRGKAATLGIQTHKNKVLSRVLSVCLDDEGCPPICQL